MSFLSFNIFRCLLIDRTLITYTSFLPTRAVFLPFLDPGPVPCFFLVASFDLVRPLEVPLTFAVQMDPLLIKDLMFSRVIESATSSNLSGSNLTLLTPTPRIRDASSLFLCIFTTIHITTFDFSLGLKLWMNFSLGLKLWMNFSLGLKLWMNFSLGLKLWMYRIQIFFR